MAAAPQTQNQKKKNQKKKNKSNAISKSRLLPFFEWEKQYNQDLELDKLYTSDSDDEHMSILKQSYHQTVVCLNEQKMNKIKNNPVTLVTLPTQPILFEFSSNCDANDLKKWNDLIRNFKSILSQKKKIILKINKSLPTQTQTITKFQEFLVKIGGKTTLNAIYTHPQYQSTMRIVIMNCKNNKKYKLMKHIQSCQFDKDIINISLNLNYSDFVGDDQGKAKILLATELGNVFKLNPNCIIFKSIKPGSILISFKIFGTWISFPWFGRSRFVISEPGRLYDLGDTVTVNHNGTDYNAKIMKREESFDDPSRMKLYIKYLNPAWHWLSKYELIDVDADNMKPLNPRKPEVISGQIEGNEESLKFEWIEEYYNM